MLINKCFIYILLKTTINFIFLQGVKFNYQAFIRGKLR
jgi:hypothetical protein